MIKKNQHFFNIINEATDAITIIVSYAFSVWVWLDIKEDVASSNISKDMTIAVIYTIGVLILFKIFKLYDSFRFKSIRNEIVKVIKINGIATMSMGLIFYALKMQEFSRGVVVVFFIISTVTLSVKRVALRSILRRYRKLGYNQKHILIVGNGRLAKKYSDSIRLNPQYGFNVFGYVSKTQRDGLGKHLGRYEDMSEILLNNNIDEVVIALEPHELAFISYAINACEKQGTRVYLIPLCNDYIPTEPDIDVIGDIKLINLRTIPLDSDFNALQKKMLDIIVSAVIIVCTSPIMLIVAIGTMLSSKGPIIFKQERIGRGKKVFTMYKFRSMRINVESNVAWSTNTDPRKTKFGSFIRKMSIDELPQFFNVLKGDMSIVGPRPEVPHYVEKFKEEIPMYMIKHQVRPGITGWAQVNGYRGDTSIEERIKHDIWYIENWNIWLDIKIIIKTVFGGMINKEKIK